MIRPGKILFDFYYKPLGFLQTTFKTGLRRTAQLKKGKREMASAAQNLKEITFGGQPPFYVYFLTGKKYWFQTAFCLYSLQEESAQNIHAYILDDGSFDDKLVAVVKNGFPTTTTIIRQSRIEELLDEKLPAHTFPALRKRRIEYPHLRKLTDVHVLGGGEPKLVLDSDMLFFNKPMELLAWLTNPVGLLFMQDVSESYGYSSGLMKSLTGAATIPDRLNVGVAGIQSARINWPELERWTAELLKREGSSYLQEQALTAMIAAKENYSFLDEHQYKVLPQINGKTVPETLHHYVADSKFDYFVKGWKFFRAPH